MRMDRLLPARVFEQRKSQWTEHVDCLRKDGSHNVRVEESFVEMGSEAIVARGLILNSTKGWIDNNREFP